MTEPLDRPIWAALTTRQAALGLGDDHARRFHPDISPFAAARDDAPESLAALTRLVRPEEAVLLLQVGTVAAPAGLIAEDAGAGVQMVAAMPINPTYESRVVDLTEDDAPAMLALATLTRPGPFLPRTHRLGGFVGIKFEGRLVAMAGERLKLPGFTEVSGVCTHPDAQGQGYAGLLSRVVASRLQARGETPFLHAYSSNVGAIRLYEKLGFRLRTEVAVTRLTRPLDSPGGD